MRYLIVGILKKLYKLYPKSIDLKTKRVSQTPLEVWLTLSRFS
jgi:hypothetical protein